MVEGFDLIGRSSDFLSITEEINRSCLILIAETNRLMLPQEHHPRHLFLEDR